ncbi:MAG: ATP-binding cassette domain-containing protein [Actinomycetes bacterium]
MAIIEVHDVHKTYRRRRRPPKAALDGLDLSVDEGGVHGFLGPNGSGKTTLLRCLLGLARTDSGEMSMFGKPTPGALPDFVGDVGSLLESPAFFPPYSGRLNLSLLATSQHIPRPRVDEVLEIVGLTDAADDRVKGYSLGMRQRLGIAAAMLNRPRVLVLDEPSNGLDPAGMKEVRHLLRQLADQGTTVLLSSHLLNEVQQICDQVTIVSHGRRVTTGTVESVLTSHTGHAVRLGIADAPAAVAILTSAGFAARDEGGLGVVVDNAPDASLVTKALADGGRYVSWLQPEREGLEEVFLRLTAEPDVPSGSQQEVPS